MTTELRRIDPPADHPTAARAYTLTNNGQHLGTVVLIASQRPHGSTIRRDWWPILPTDDTSPPFRQPFETRQSAIQALRYHHTIKNRPAPPAPTDTTLDAIQAARDDAGTAAAIDDARQATLTEAYRNHPERFGRRPKPPAMPNMSWINEPSKELNTN